MQYKTTLSLLLMAAAAMPAAAQYDQDINVEGKYVPEYIDHARIGLFPKPVRFPHEKSELQYYMTGVNAKFSPQIVPMQATGWNTSRSYSTARGYVDFGIGSWLESTLSAGYRIIDTRKSALGVRLQHNSTSLWKPKLSEGTSDIRRRRYDESLGLYGHHDFDGSGRLDAALDYHLGCFNYYGFDPTDGWVGSMPPTPAATRGAYWGDSYTAPTQTLNDIAARVGWQSPVEADNLWWHAGAGVRYFGYRSMYWYSQLPADGDLKERFRGSRETATSIEAGLRLPTSSSSTLGLELDGTLLTYAHNPIPAVFMPPVDLPGQPDNYGMIKLTPYYRFNRAGINIRLGAEIDLAFNAGERDSRYSTFHIAPDISLDYNAGPVTFYLYALGGSRLNTLAANYELDYYQNPTVYSTRPTYTPLDSKLGVSFGPFAGFHAGFDIAYRISRGQYTGGWYMAMLNLCRFDPEVIGLPDLDPAGGAIRYAFSPDVRLDMSGFSFGMSMGYDSGRYFRIDASARYQRQQGETGYFNGYDRPEWTADVTAESNPWSSLKLRIGYSLRAMRMMTAPYWNDSNTPLNGLGFADLRLPNKSMLNFGASYGITENFDVMLQADNLLNRRHLLFPCLPEPKLTVTAGFAWRF